MAYQVDYIQAETYRVPVMSGVLPHESKKDTVSHTLRFLRYKTQAEYHPHLTLWLGRLTLGQ